MKSLKGLREERGLTQRELAELVSIEGYPAVDVALVGYLERNDIYPGAHLLKALCKALKCEEKDLFICKEEQTEHQREHEEKWERRNRAKNIELAKRMPQIDKNLHCVYMLTFPDGKKYIGQTKSGETKKRWKNGAGYYGMKVFRHILAAGWNNIKTEVLFDNLTQEEASDLELQMIEKYDSIRNGHNMVFAYSGRRRRIYGEAEAKSENR